MKCWNSAFNAQGSRRIIVYVQVCRSSENICSSSGGAQEWKKAIKIDDFLSFTLSFFLMYFFEGFFESHPVYDQTHALVLSFPDFTDNSNILRKLGELYCNETIQRGEAS